MDQLKSKNMYEKIGNLSIENKYINFFVFCISIQWCKDCQTVQTLYKTRINFRFLSNSFLSSCWSMKTKYLLYFQKVLPKLLFEWLYVYALVCIIEPLTRALWGSGCRATRRRAALQGSARWRAASSSALCRRSPASRTRAGGAPSRAAGPRTGSESQAPVRAPRKRTAPGRRPPRARSRRAPAVCPPPRPVRANGVGARNRVFSASHRTGTLT